MICTFKQCCSECFAECYASKQAVHLCLQEHHITAYDQLFQDGHRRMLRQEEYAHWYAALLQPSATSSRMKPHQATPTLTRHLVPFLTAHANRHC